MRITTKVTERDKKLLIFLCAFLLAVGFVWLLLKPMCEDITELNAKIALAKNEQQSNAIALQQIESSEQKLAENTAALLEAAAPFRARMKNEELDELLTGEALFFGFQKSDLRELVIQNPDEFLRLEPYRSETELKDAKPLTGIYGASVQFTVHGGREALQRFCSEFATKYSDIRVMAYTWQSDGQDEDGWLLTMQLQILMTDAEQLAAQAPDGTQPAG